MCKLVSQNDGYFIVVPSCGLRRDQDGWPKDAVRSLQPFVVLPETDVATHTQSARNGAHRPHPWCTAQRPRPMENDSNADRSRDEENRANPDTGQPNVPNDFPNGVIARDERCEWMIDAFVDVRNRNCGKNGIDTCWPGLPC